ncbi:MAG: hypothetical protein JRI53_04155 [Deltaproteobacteria bacterium]|nr:hypothetical protein [Deltaproteobacteria bacterium]MBW1983890.1 hypothetical protein [Deltaproteobacteria bacterium]MBW2179729.1 hypothetical protein [Deltaproteobacteria bacterium]
MPVKFTKNDSNDLTIIDIIGDVTLEDIFDAVQQYEKSGLSKYEIYNFQNYTGPHLGFEELRNVSTIIPNIASTRPQGSKTALLWSESDPVGFGISRQVIALLEVKNVHFEMNVFYSMNEALVWIGIVP